MSATLTASLRTIERDSIRAFVASQSHLLTGRVLDYGCGQQPYRYLVEEAGGHYVGYDRADFPANVSREDVGPADPFEVGWDAILCTQVLQYAVYPRDLVNKLAWTLVRGGHLVMTGPTCWPCVERADMFRFTRSGITRLMTDAGLTVVVCEDRGGWPTGEGEDFSLGWGAVGYRA